MAGKIYPFLLLTVLFTKVATAQTDSINARADIRKFQDELTEEYRSKEKSPLTAEDFKNFKGHDFFPINLKFRVVAKLKRTASEPFFQMETTRPRVNMERVYGILTFSIDGKEFQLPVYQSESLMKKDEYRDYLFLPFTDLTNGNETYDGGRYIDLRIPSGDELVIDFNKAYNPYCAYNYKYSCPIVPSRNHLEIKILAGIRYSKK